METAEYDAMRAFEDDHWWYSSLRSLVLENLGSAQKILDVGCGTGGMLARLRERDAYGIDYSETAISHCRGRGLARICRASACALPFRDGSFDAVLALDVIYHKAVADDGAAIAECARVLRPGGILLLHVPACDWLSGRHDLATHGARRYSRERIGTLVREAGLQISLLTYRNVLAMLFAIARRRLHLGAGPGSGPGGSSELAPLVPAINSALGFAGRVENALLGIGPIPAGLSVWCRAIKKR